MPGMIEFGDWDFKKPNYALVLQKRAEALARIRSNPRKFLPAIKQYYREHPAAFISDWGMTFDPRNPERDLPSAIPFILFPKQEEWVSWVVDHWKRQRRGLSEKSRDCGLSWLAVSVADTLCLFNPGLAIGFGSRKEEYVDRSDNPNSLFFKARFFIENLPIEFRGGWLRKKHSSNMRLTFPETNSYIFGEAGDNIGRGARGSIFFLDEAAFIDHSEMVDAALSQTTNCQIDISTPNGMANAFAQRRHHQDTLPEDIFSFHWRDDPRKGDDWYAGALAKMEHNKTKAAQELDISYTASVEDTVIQAEWIQAAIDSHIKLGISPSGIRSGALDIADKGKDLNAFCGGYGFLVDYLEEWSGKNSDVLESITKAFSICDAYEYEAFRYDSDGIGGAADGMARIENASRMRRKQSPIKVIPFWGSGGVVNPDRKEFSGRTNKDYFMNFKAQSWWALRARFYKTWNAVANGQPINHEDLISISGSLRLRQKLINELSQPKWKSNGLGKIVIDKQPDDARSPNLADALMMRFASPGRSPIKIGSDAFSRFSRPGVAVAPGGTVPSAHFQDALRRFGG